jgi:hypothetical protein
VRTLEEVAAHAVSAVCVAPAISAVMKTRLRMASNAKMLGLGVANDGFDRRAAAQVAFDRVGDAALLAGDVDLHLVVTSATSFAHALAPARQRRPVERQLVAEESSPQKSWKYGFSRKRARNSSSDRLCVCLRIESPASALSEAAVAPACPSRPPRTAPPETACRSSRPASPAGGPCRRFGRAKPGKGRSARRPDAPSAALNHPPAVPTAERNQDQRRRSICQIGPSRLPNPAKTNTSKLAQTPRISPSQGSSRSLSRWSSAAGLRGARRGRRCSVIRSQRGGYDVSPSLPLRLGRYGSLSARIET